ncbi:flavin monoamine oxidase family protein [Sulfitobacter albidus]|uniref:flavin monoamine oxidase family protein n=1 Tax=Sulfitobacter albidus TaxID=2829501 RepID=UPI0032AFDEC7
MHLNSPVRQLEASIDAITVTLASGRVMTARQLVLALPPRLAAQLEFAPALPVPTITAMTTCATWMAGQAKAVAVFDTPFWRDQGLSGDAMSRRGPMVEIHDASPARDGPCALFGFIGVPPDHRHDRAALEQAVTAQLVRLFGPQAAAPRALHLKDWAADPYTATDADRAPLTSHPRYGLPDAMRGLWGGRLLFGGTETAAHFGGYLEGALEAAEDVLSRVHHVAQSPNHA